MFINIFNMLLKFILLVVFQTTLTLGSDTPFYDVDNYKEMGHHFEEFVKKYQRQYTGDVKVEKFNIFIENLKNINALNSRNSSATYGVNEFADYTEAEFRSLLGFVSGPSDGACSVEKPRSTASSPASWDWRDQNAVSPVKSQEKCGSCWAFSATALVESKYMQKGQSLSLSEQQLVDCDQQSNGCNGGQMNNALSSIMSLGGQESESDYPYTSGQSSCAFDQSKAVARVASCTSHIVSDEAVLQDLLYSDGPLAISLDAAAWGKYTGGVSVDCDGRVLNHAVLLVGYGSENNEDYWIIKNSWGAEWGEQGFIRIRKGIGCCGLASSDPNSVVSATVP